MSELPPGETTDARTKPILFIIDNTQEIFFVIIWNLYWMILPIITLSHIIDNIEKTNLNLKLCYPIQEALKSVLYRAPKWFDKWPKKG